MDSNYSRPSPWDCAMACYKLEHGVDFDLLLSPGMCVVPSRKGSDSRRLLELPHRIAWENRRIWGVICRLKQCGSLNTSTPYMLTAACPITYVDPHTSLRTDILARAVAFSSNLLATTAQCVLLGDLVTGVATATFGGNLTCQLESWRTCSAEEC